MITLEEKQGDKPQETPTNQPKGKALFALIRDK